MRIPSQHTLARALSSTSAAEATLRPYWLTTSQEPAFLVEPIAPAQEGPPAVLEGLRSAVSLYPVFIPGGDLEFLLPAGNGRDSSRSDYAAKALAGALLPAAQTLVRPDFVFDELGDLTVSSSEIVFAVQGVQRRFGRGPDPALLIDAWKRGELRCQRDLQRWLLSWECEQFGESACLAEHREHFVGSFLCRRNSGLVALLPVSSSWEAFAHLLWWGSQWHFEAKIAALRRWHERFGAVLCCAGSTTLYLRVQRRPSTLDEAFELAVEHWYFAADTLILPGVSLREYARVLLSQDHWYFHERP